MWLKVGALMAKIGVVCCRNISYNKRPKRNVWAPVLLPNLRSVA